MYQPQLISIANKKLKGLWTQVPLYANDFSAWAWE
jgi:peptide/nickel transport system substrate-binding protein